MPCRTILPFDQPTLLAQVLADAITQVALQLDRISGNCAAGATATLQLLGELRQESLVIGQIVDDRDCFPATPLLFHAQLGDDAVRDRLVDAPLAAAFAVFYRPPTAWTDLADACRIHNPAITHTVKYAAIANGAGEVLRSAPAQRARPMKAIVVKPGVKDSIHMRDVPDPELKPDQVAVKMIRAGLCATDAEINHGLYGQAPEGDEYLILGHENFGVVEHIGKKVKGLKAGDFVVSTVRRPCKCYVCKAGQSDMCHEGAYQERGIVGRHGFMAEYYVESPQWLNKIPKNMAEIAVLLEPISVVEKGIDHAFLLQERLDWKPKTALVLGAGTIGLLAAAVFRARGLETHVIGREPENDNRAQLTKKMGANYHSVADKTLFDVKKEMAPIDVAIEATGAASVAFDGMQILGPNGVLCLLSLTGGSKTANQPIDRINQQLVLGNQIVFGSVNANQRHFAMGLNDFSVIEKKWPGVLKQLITARLPWAQYHKWFGQRGSGIKTTLEIS